LVIATVAAGCSSSGTSVSGSALSFTEKDYNIAPAAASATAGTVKFKVKNTAGQDHEFVVFRTDLDAAKLPLTGDGQQIDEAGPGVTHVDEIAAIGPGKTMTLSVTLDAGRYVMVCNLPTHYKLGMHTVVTVS
jgi:uncharacterized cupredoxin-like copper-binding protein